MSFGEKSLTVVEVERRGWPRLKVDWCIRLFRAKEPMAVNATLENISSGGVSFVSSTRFEKGERLKSHILLPVETQPWGNGPVMLECDLQVLRAELGSALEYRLGCEIKSYRIRAARSEPPANGDGYHQQ
jgi:hypothetical protein